MIKTIKKLFKRKKLTSNEVLFDIKLKLDKVSDTNIREVLKFDFEATLRQMESKIHPTDEEILFIVEEMFNLNKTASDLFPKVAKKVAKKRGKK